MSLLNTVFSLSYAAILYVLASIQLVMQKAARAIVRLTAKRSFD